MFVYNVHPEIYEAALLPGTMELGFVVSTLN